MLFIRDKHDLVYFEIAEQIICVCTVLHLTSWLHGRELYLPVYIYAKLGGRVRKTPENLEKPHGTIYFSLYQWLWHTLRYFVAKFKKNVITPSIAYFGLSVKPCSFLSENLLCDKEYEAFYKNLRPFLCQNTRAVSACVNNVVNYVSNPLIALKTSHS